MANEPEFRYGAQGVRSSLKHFAVGRLLGAGIGLFWLFMLVRAMPAADYGAYFTFYAYVEVMILVSAWGSVQLQERFVPELAARCREAAAAQLASRILFIRVLLLLGTVALTQIFEAWLLRLIGLEHYAGALIWVNGILVVEGLCRTVDSFHESLMMQRSAQLSTLLRFGLRAVALVLVVALQGMVDLGLWLQIELAALALGLCVSLAQFQKTRRSLLERPVGDGALEWQRYWRFALLLFAHQLVWLLSSIDVVKLWVNRGYGLEVAALFGFCLALVQVIQRYLPTVLLAGLVRPLFIVAQQQLDRTQRVAALTQLMIKLNLLLLLPLLVLGCAQEATLLGLASGSVWPGGAQVLCLLLLWLVLVAVKNCYALVATAWEDGRATLISSGAAALTFAVGGSLLWQYGLFALLGVVLLSELISLLTLAACLRSHGLKLGLPLPALALLALSQAAGQGLLMWVARNQAWSPLTELLVATLLCGGLAAAVAVGPGFFSPTERARLSGLLPPKLAARLAWWH